MCLFFKYIKLGFVCFFFVGVYAKTPIEDLPYRQVQGSTAHLASSNQDAIGLISIDTASDPPIFNRRTLADITGEQVLLSPNSFKHR